MRLKHEAKPNPLPPIWVKFFSFMFLFFILHPWIKWSLREVGGTHAINGFGLKLQSGIVSEGWIYALETVYFLAGLTGFFILTKRSFAYGFGILYCFIALAVTIPAHFFVGVSCDHDGNSVALQYLLLLCFLVHLIRHRRQWVQRYGIRSLKEEFASRASA